jgi:hypothetical protein
MSDLSAEHVSPGRVHLQADNATDVSRLPGFQYQTTGSIPAGADGIRGNWEANLLNQTFFSQDNFQIVQNKIRYEVYRKTQKVIDPQSSDDLFMIMRAIYLQFGKNQPTNIAGQIEELNQRVAEWCVPKIVAEMQMYQTYLHDIENLPVPLEHPVSQSSAGTKSLPFKQFF